MEVFGVQLGGKGERFSKVQVPDGIASRFEVLNISVGVSIILQINLPQQTSRILY